MTPTRNQPRPAATDAAEPELLMLDPKTLLLDGNVRTTADLDQDFLDSIREHGVLVAISAVRTAEGHVRVRYGQRRTLAAIEVARTPVPVVITGTEQPATDAEQVARIVTQVHENKHRRGLNTADETAAVQQLAAFGLSAADIHRQVKGQRADVEHALAVAGSKLATKAVGRYDFLDLSQAATVAEFESDAETVKALIAAAKKSPGTFEHLAQRLRDERAREQELADARQKLTDAGVALIDRAKFSDMGVKTLQELSADANSAAPLTANKHKNCSGHAAYVSRSWTGKAETLYVCTGWKAAGHRLRGGAAPAAALSPAEREKASAERREVRDNNSAWRSAETVRRAWLQTLLARKSAPKGAAAFVALELVHNPHELSQATQWSGNPMLRDLLGCKTQAALVAASQKASDARAQVLTLAFVLAAYEAKTGTHTWRSEDAGVARYFAFLAAQGYELAEVERLCLPTPSTRSRREKPAAPAANMADEQVAS